MNLFEYLTIFVLLEDQGCNLKKTFMKYKPKSSNSVSFTMQFFDFEVSGLSVPEFNIGFFLAWFICVLHMLPDSAEKEEIRKRFRHAITIFCESSFLYFCHKLL